MRQPVAPGATQCRTVPGPDVDAATSRARRDPVPHRSASDDPSRPSSHNVCNVVTRGARRPASGPAASAAVEGLESALPPAPEMVRRSSGEQAAVHIRRLIFDGHLRPGVRVPQEQIARTLGISRIPIREALIALEREGWVTIELHRGAFVNALDALAVSDTYDLFGLVYGFAVDRAMDRGMNGVAQRLVAIERSIEATDDPEEIGRLVIAFHAAIVEAARSPRVKVVLRAMSGLIPGNFFALVPGAIEMERKGLNAIVRAVTRGDAGKAAEEYKRMMRRQGELVVRLFEERGLFAPPDTEPDGRTQRRSAAGQDRRGGS
jgi:DNA-binding GntR family transcriptional regulator